MKITIESTNDKVLLREDNEAIPARIWKGVTEGGLPVTCVMLCIYAPKVKNLEEFDRDLEGANSPTLELPMPVRVHI